MVTAFGSLEDDGTLTEKRNHRFPQLANLNSTKFASIHALKSAVKLLRRLIYFNRAVIQIHQAEIEPFIMIPYKVFISVLFAENQLPCDTNG